MYAISGMWLKNISEKSLEEIFEETKKQLLEKQIKLQGLVKESKFSGELEIVAKNLEKK